MSDVNESPRSDETPAGTAEVTPKRGRRTGILIGAIALTALVTFGITALAINILARQSEGRVAYAQIVDVDETTVDPAVWGQNFPVQYSMYLRTSEMVPTTHGGSTPTEHEPTDTDPRTIVSASRLEEEPNLVELWDGYPFSVDYRHARGHAYMLEDQLYTLRVTEFNQPGTCLNCHASTPTVMAELGDGDINAGFDAMNAMSYADASKLVDHPVSCIDCHDPETMEIVITRPAFINGIADYMASRGIEDYDVNEDASAADMRSYVCGQCHVEYYFDGEEKTLVFPWSNGITIDEILGYYLDDGHIDFTHARSETQVIKAQHPEFDIWTQGIHGQAGVSCADCHMPYQREGSIKVSNHHIQSPLLEVNQSCGTCHNVPDEELIGRVETIQDNFIQARDQALANVVTLIGDIEAALTDGTPADDVAQAQQYHQAASFYVDYVYSENSYGFHADQYMMQILADANNFVLQGQRALAGNDVETVEDFLGARDALVDASSER